MNLGAMVTSTKGIATHITHIKGTIIRSLPTSAKLSINRSANIATINFPTTAAGIKFLSFAKDKNLIPAAVVGKLIVAMFALLFIESFALVGSDLIIVPLMCVMCVAIPFVLVTIAPRFIPAAEVNLFFLLETIIGPIWVWLIIKEQPSLETMHSFKTRLLLNNQPYPNRTNYSL